ncbi:hypothetical protein ASC77_24380 [Nocardioides sp. Root1257]|uniref:hypothetical protein n=1 Tax=unclassified Nocardioides TaxID=2615069 RepID=UPI0006F21B7D|nr:MULTISPECIES: hypothetical protein [unclassified Nocardioides]KQW52517.1 hypothetical protein ASC77_24380 [Nocardioides sp. Root1257]KRC54580.1 hypothetical protein ASE24_24170 [Nocardioides sp. Root224]
MRTRLGAQREAEEMLAEASTLRRTAAEEAETIVAEAETLATQLVTEAREAAEQLAAEAKERADGILARAYYEAEDLQRHTEEERARIREEVVAAGRAEIEEFRARSADSLDSAEAGLSRLAPSLEGAVATVSEVLRSLEVLRHGPAEVEVAAPAVLAPRTSGSDTDADPAEPPQQAAEPAAEVAPATKPDDAEARPLGWLFRASQT